MSSLEAALKQAELNLEWTEVRAPIAGRISDRRVDAGNLDHRRPDRRDAADGHRVDRTHPFHVRRQRSGLPALPAARRSRRAASRRATCRIRCRSGSRTRPNTSIIGRMDFVDNAVNPKTGTIRGRAIFDNKDGLLTPGFFGRLRLFGGETRRAAGAGQRDRLRSGQQDRVHRRRRRHGRRQAGRARAHRRWPAGHPLGPRADRPHRHRRPAARAARARRSRPRTARSKPSPPMPSAATDRECST